MSESKRYPFGVLVAEQDGAAAFPRSFPLRKWVPPELSELPPLPGVSQSVAIVGWHPRPDYSGSRAATRQKR